MEKLIGKLQEWGTRQVVVLADSNVAALYPRYFENLADAFPCHFMEIPAGENSKNVENAVRVWERLLELNMDRSDTLLMFGGGMVCDLGGFIAATFKRGIHCVYCPTTLLAMIDAAIGGKTAVNLNHVKNCVGLVRQPDYIMSPDLAFLETLPAEELKSGFGEIIKYALIASFPLFDELRKTDVLSADSIQESWIQKCVAIKNRIVESDPCDYKERHVLNFGHTFGHAIEGYQASLGQSIPHGAAVAAGLLYESELSEKITGLPHDQLLEIKNLVRRHFDVPEFSEELWRKWVPFMHQDKKNKEGKINFTLLKEIGTPVISVYIQDYPF